MKEVINNDDIKLIMELEYVVNEYFYIKIFIKSGSFSGENIFSLYKENLKENIESFKKMNENLNGKCELIDSDSDSIILFELKEFGHMNISGLIGGTHREQYLKFNLQTDQTIIEKIINQLENFITLEHKNIKL